MELCKHSCPHYLELVNRSLWHKLPLDLIELVFAKLPSPLIRELRDQSRAWAALTQSVNFKQACAEKHPKVFGLVGWDEYGLFRNSVLDINSNKWFGYFLEDFMRRIAKEDEADDGYVYSMYAGDGGLVCFVPGLVCFAKTVPILMANSLTNESKSLPLIPDLEDTKVMIMVQIMVDLLDTKTSYKVMVVVGKSVFRYSMAALSYDSVSGEWSSMEIGIIYGSGSSLFEGRTQRMVFNCTTKELFDVLGSIENDGIDVISSSVVQDRVVVVHDLPQHRADKDFMNSEFEWQARLLRPYGWKVRRVKYMKSTLKVLPDNYNIFHFATRNYVLLVGDNCDEKY